MVDDCRLGAVLSTRQGHQLGSNATRLDTREIVRRTVEWIGRREERMKRKKQKQKQTARRQGKRCRWCEKGSNLSIRTDQGKYEVAHESAILPPPLSKVVYWRLVGGGQLRKGFWCGAKLTAHVLGTRVYPVPVPAYCTKGQLIHKLLETPGTSRDQQGLDHLPRLLYGVSALSKKPLQQPPDGELPGRSILGQLSCTGRVQSTE